MGGFVQAGLVSADAACRSIRLRPHWRLACAGRLWGEIVKRRFAWDRSGPVCWNADSRNVIKTHSPGTGPAQCVGTQIRVQTAV